MYVKISGGKKLFHSGSIVFFFHQIYSLDISVLIMLKCQFNKTFAEEYNETVTHK